MQNSFSSQQPLNNRAGLLTNGWFIWGIAALFYAYEFVHRVSPSVMIPDLMQSFDASRAALGYLSSSYFYAYALFQIPAGMLVDRYGVKTILMLASMLVVLGSFMMSTAHSLPFGCFNRFLIGAGSAFAFVSCLKLADHWIEKKYFPLIVGLTNLCGMLGAISGGEPLAHSMQTLTWQEVYWLLGFIGLTISASIWLCIKDKANDSDPLQSLTLASQRLTQGIKSIIRTPLAWLLALYATLMVAPITSFAELWGVEYFQTSYGLDRRDSAQLIKYIFYGIAVGGPTIGWIYSRLPRLKLLMILGSSTAFILMGCILYLPNLSSTGLKSLLFCYGFATSHMLLCFSLANENYPSWTHGAVLGFINMMVMAGSAIFQPLIGKLIDLNMSLATKQKLFAQLSLGDFQLALSILPICILFGICLTFFIKANTTQS